MTRTLLTYDEVGVPIAIDDLIQMISPFDVPFQEHFGFTAMPEPKEIRYEWLEDELMALANRLNGAVTAVATTWILHSTAFAKAGDILRCGGEQVRVTTVVSATNLTVVRGYGGTVGVAHVDGASVDLMGPNLPEGQITERDTTARTIPFNVTQIFSDRLGVSRSTAEAKKYGITNLYDYHMAKKLKEQAILLERNLIYGRRLDDTVNRRRTMGGLNFYISTGVHAAGGAAIDYPMLVTVLRSAYDRGGRPDLLICSPRKKADIDLFNQSFLRVPPTEKTRSSIVDYIDTSFGRLSIMMNRYVRDTEIFIVQSEYIKLMTFTPWQKTLLAKTDDTDSGMLVGEFTMVIKNERAHIKIDNLAL